MNIKLSEEIDEFAVQEKKRMFQNRDNPKFICDLSKRIFEVILAEKVTVDVAERALHRALLLVRSRTIVGP